MSITFILGAFICLTTNLYSQSKAPLIKATITISGSCRTGNTCGTWSYSLKKVNTLTIVNQSTQWYPSLEVTISSCPTCTPITTFVCNQQTIIYASSKLTNNASFYVKLRDVNSSNSSSYTFTNGSFNGQNCITEQTQKPEYLPKGQ